jgi:outer membrane protein assembly factor BamB
MPSTEFSRRAVLRGSALAGAGALAGCSALAGGPDPEPLPDATPGPDDWPTTGYDARNTRYNAEATPPDSEPTPRWTRDFRGCRQPLVRGARVVLNAENSTVGLRATDGAEVWRSDAEPWFFQDPTLGAERAYATGSDCGFGYELGTGEQTWRGTPCHGANTHSGTIANGRLYLEYGGYVTAFDATGRATWAAAADVEGSPSVVGDTAFVATAFTVEALDLTADASEWPWEGGDDDEPAHADRDAVTKWSVPPQASTVGPRAYDSPAVSESLVFATYQRQDEPGGRLRALDRATGDERWAVGSPPVREVGEQPEPAPDPVSDPTPPVVSDDLILAALGDRRIRAVTRGGETRWTQSLDGNVAELVAGGDLLLAATHDPTIERTGPDHGRIVAFDIEDGTRRWSLGFDDHVANLAIAGGSVYATRVVERDADGNQRRQRLLALS